MQSLVYTSLMQTLHSLQYWRHPCIWHSILSKDKAGILAYAFGVASLPLMKAGEAHLSFLGMPKLHPTGCFP